jgi:hypothetical protein
MHGAAAVPGHRREAAVTRGPVSREQAISGRLLPSPPQWRRRGPRRRAGITPRRGRRPRRYRRSPTSHQPQASRSIVLASSATRRSRKLIAASSSVAQSMLSSSRVSSVRSSTRSVNVRTSCAPRVDLEGGRLGLHRVVQRDLRLEQPARVAFADARAEARAWRTRPPRP